MIEKCPVPAPKLLKAQSTVETCQCGAWLDRYPSFYGESDHIRECHRCDDCLYFHIRDGRAYGPKSREWAKIVGVFEECFTDITPDYWDTVECEPPMKDLDWNAIEDWYRSQGIYHVYIGFGTIYEFAGSDE